MTPENILETIKKHGALGVTIIALFWMNSRLSNVEAKLYECYLQNVSKNAYEVGEYDLIPEFYAVLPSNPVGKIKKDA